MARPRLLFIAPAMPDARGNGLAMRQGQFLAAYAADFDIDLAVVALAGPADADARFARKHANRFEVFPAPRVDTHFRLLTRLKDPAERHAAFLSFGRPSITARLTDEVRQALTDWSDASYDLLHIGRLYLAGLGPSLPIAARIIDADEDDARVFRQLAKLAQRQGDQQAAAWADAEAANAARHAAPLLRRFDQVVTADAADARALAPLNERIFVVPNTLPARRLPSRRRGAARLLFVGTLGYRPNEDAMLWFIRTVWPRLRKAYPKLRLDIVGGGGGAELRRAARRPGITLRGWLRDLTPAYAAATVVVAPLRAGGGSRIKLIEAALSGRAIVATAQGAEGGTLRAKRDFLCADEPRSFARAIAALLDQPGYASRLGATARRAALRGHDEAPWRARIRALARRIASGATP